MKILILCKQSPMGKNLLTRPYGRFYYLAKHLADNGHEIHFLALNYKLSKIHCQRFSNINWTSISIFSLFGISYYLKAKKLAKTINPEWIISFSDTYYAILANYLSKKFNSHCLIDAYDNYESYAPWLKFIHVLWRRALVDADLISVAGPSLAKLFSNYCRRGKIFILPMSADPQFSHNLDVNQCREQLGLSTSSKIIGFCGGITHKRGIKYLIQAFEIIKQEREDIEFIISGQKDNDIKLPSYINFLGYISDSQMPCLIRSLNVLVAVNLDNEFGNYSYPVKIYEALRSHIPVVATSTASTRWILKNTQDSLVPANDAYALANTIMTMLDFTIHSYIPTDNWYHIAEKLESTLSEYLQEY